MTTPGLGPSPNAWMFLHPQQQPVLRAPFPTATSPSPTPSPSPSPMPSAFTFAGLAARRPSARAPSPYFASPRPDFPASNQPQTWKELAPIVEHSPLLQAQLAELARSGWAVNFNRGRGSSCLHAARRLDIDTGHSRRMAVQDLAHEAHHALETPLLPAQFRSDMDFTLARMRNEALAVVNHLRVRAEIHDATGLDIGIDGGCGPYYEMALRFSHQHGSLERLLRHIMDMYLWEPAGTAGGTYLETYANAWRDPHGLPRIRMHPHMAARQQQGVWNRLLWEMRLEEGPRAARAARRAFGRRGGA